MEGKRSLLIRADVSTRMGTGHLSRCLTLAAGLKRHGHPVSFVTKPYDERLVATIERAGYSLHRLPLECGLEQDCIATIRLARRANPKAAVLLDSYSIDESYQRAVKEADLNLIVIDDLANHPAWADLVINQNIYAQREMYSAQPYTRLLLGPRYALLRREFAPLHEQQKSVPKQAGNILVTLGGSDPENQTLKVMRALASLDAPLEARVVLGASYRGHESLQPLLAQAGGRFSIYTDLPAMSPMMAWADLAISGGGSTCWELACAGVPNSILVLAQNQRKNAIGLSQAGISVNLGWWEEVSTGAIAEATAMLIADQGQREAMSRAGRALVDGRGVERVVAEIERVSGVAGKRQGAEHAYED